MHHYYYYILVNESGVYVKDCMLFEAQSGLRENWGKNWEYINALSLYDARAIGIKLRRERFPDCHKTLGEDGEAPENYWPEAKGK